MEVKWVGHNYYLLTLRYKKENFMAHSFSYLLICLLVGIVFIVLLTARFQMPAFFALLAASFIVGLMAGIPIEAIISEIKDGFGNIMKSLGLIIVMGTTLGGLLEHNGSISVISAFILRKMGERFITLSMNIIGFVVGMPVFCDSGFIILSSLNNTVSQSASISRLVNSISLATGLLAVHCLIPPHPGASAAASLLNVDFGNLLLFGILVAIPVSLVGYKWAVYAGKKINIDSPVEDPQLIKTTVKPSLFFALLPIIVPVMLMASRSFAIWAHITVGILADLISICGEPVIALMIGVLFAIFSWRSRSRKELMSLLAEDAGKAGGILVIIGAGGAFGGVLSALNFGQHLGASIPISGMGILLPFLVTSILKTAQGSSTVAIISAASLIQPLLPVLGLGSANGHLLCVLSMGTGSMMISHANDAYFWVIARFSSLEPRHMFRLYTPATICMALTGFSIVCILSLLLPH
jgi:gluconate:H+ symporter, GntP family